MTILAPFVVHTAGPPTGAVQRCGTCGFVIMDNTAWFEGCVMVMNGDDCGPSWWPFGALVATDKADGCASITYVVEGRELDADERPCAGAN